MFAFSRGNRIPTGRSDQAPRRNQELRKVLGQFLIAMAVVCLMADAIQACNIPVFRYALEKWNAANHEVLVFHRGKLEGQEQKALEYLQNAIEPGETSGKKLKGTANFSLKLVDLDEKVSPELRELYQAEKSKGNRIIVRFPADFQARTRSHLPYWSGPVTLENAKALVSSPAREKITKEIFQGTSTVWVFLDSGKKAEDEKRYKAFVGHLAKLEKQLKLPELTNDPDDKLSSDLELKLKFSVVRVSRKTAAERVFTKMLLSTESDLYEYQEPMVFPVFAKGRALYALVGKGITWENVYKAGAYLTGPCTCKVKEQNPGVDLLFRAPWDKVIGTRLVKDKELPPLTGVGGPITPKKKSQPKKRKSDSKDFDDFDQQSRRIERVLPRLEMPALRFGVGRELRRWSRA